MATINQEIGNPSNAMERQVQTLAAEVKWLTQRKETSKANATSRMSTSRM